MIPVLIEPSVLSFDFYKTKLLSECDNNQIELSHFKTFVQHLSTIFNELQENGLVIAMTKELLNIYRESIPISVYYASDSIQKLAREVLGYKLRNLSRVIHEYGNHLFKVDFDKQSVDIHSPILQSEAYTHWRDLLGLAFLNMVPHCILKGYIISIFYSDVTILRNTNSEQIKLTIHNSIIQLITCKHLCLFKLAIALSSEHLPIEVPCCGTGNHSSMWNKPIRKLEDIPQPERELFKKLIDTGLVRTITFLAFPKKEPPTFPPVLTINRVTEGTNSDLLYGRLRGRGIKQNCQELCIEVIKGTGSYLLEACGGEITIETLEYINRIAAAAKSLS